MGIFEIGLVIIGTCFIFIGLIINPENMKLKIVFKLIIFLIGCCCMYYAGYNIVDVIFK